jgi:hypothetical protein
MKETITVKNSFTSSDIEYLKRAVTEKVAELVKRQVKNIG